MAVQLLPLEVVYTTAQNIYAVIRGVVAGTRQVWNPTLNTGAGGWEAYNSAHWAQYPVLLTEQPSSGYYAAAFPAGIVGIITSETYYNNAAPTLGDAPLNGIQYSQGRNANGLNGSPTAAANGQAAFDTEMPGTAIGTPTNQIIPTSLTSAQAAAAVNRAILFAPTAVAANCGGRVLSASGSILTLTAALPVTPSSGDAFVVV